MNNQRAEIKSAARLILEIGAEEMPAAAAGAGLDQLAVNARRLLSENRLLDAEADAKVHVYGTPRRLTVIVDELPGEQRVEVKEIKGPPAKIAFNEDGSPAPAAIGFAKSQGVSVDALETREMDGGAYLFAVVTTPGRPAAEVLPHILKELVESLEFTKAMRWGAGRFKFIRPVRWLLALYGSENIQFEVDGIKSGRLTFGHRFLAEGPFELAAASEYEDVMAQAKVVVDYEARREIIRNMVDEAAAGIGGRVFADPTDIKVLDEVTFLVEEPHVVIGEFDEGFLKVPRAALVTAMKSHQRYFPIEAADGRLMARFAVVHNGDPAFADQIRHGHERVLRARLADAAFFFNEDAKTTLESKVDRLKNVVWQAKLGTLFDKTERVRRLGVLLAKKLGLPADETALVDQAALLCKADLITSMVIEFTDLQGAIGKEYALVDREDPEVARAIEEHYFPRFAGDGLPHGTVSSITAMADKLDTLAGCFLAGLIPTGSADPYSLRRQAAGVVQILAQTRWSFAILNLVKLAIDGYQGVSIAGGGPETVAPQLHEFIIARLRRWLVDSGSDAESIEAVLSAGHDVVAEIADRVRLVDAFHGKKELEDIKLAFTRCHNLGAPELGVIIDRGLFEDPAEGELLEAFERAREEIDSSLEAGELEATIPVLASLRPAIDEFFEAVLIMVDDERVKGNRLRLLNLCVGLSERIADFSKLS
jgi:glycyl-tRNA synthetase beta chain